jgi:hypothetical protein
VLERLAGVPRRIGRSWRDLRTQPTRNTQNGSTALSTGCGAPASEPDVAQRPECSSDGVFGAFGGRSRTETDGEVAGEGRLTKRLGTFNQLSTTGRCARCGNRRVARETEGVARIGRREADNCPSPLPGLHQCLAWVAARIVQRAEGLWFDPSPAGHVPLHGPKPGHLGVESRMFSRVAEPPDLDISVQPGVAVTSYNFGARA